MGSGHRPPPQFKPADVRNPRLMANTLNRFMADANSLLGGFSVDAPLVISEDHGGINIGLDPYSIYATSEPPVSVNNNSTQTDYPPPGGVGSVEFTTTGFTLNSVVGRSPGSTMVISNAPGSTGSITVPNNSSGATGNRFFNSTGGTISIPPGNAVKFTWDPNAGGTNIGGWIDTYSSLGTSSASSGTNFAFSTFNNTNYSLFGVYKDARVHQIGTLSAPRTVTLPGATEMTGQMVLIFDASWTANATNYISIVPHGADTINLGNTTSTGFTSVIEQPGAGWLFISDGVSNWTGVCLTPECCGEDLNYYTTAATNFTFTSTLASDATLRVTGSLSGNITVTLPSSANRSGQNILVANTATMNGHSITIATSSGSVIGATSISATNSLLQAISDGSSTWAATLSSSTGGGSSISWTTGNNTTTILAPGWNNLASVVVPATGTYIVVAYGQMVLNSDGNRETIQIRVVDLTTSSTLINPVDVIGSGLSTLFLTTSFCQLSTTSISLTSGDTIELEAQYTGGTPSTADTGSVVIGLLRIS